MLTTVLKSGLLLAGASGVVFAVGPMGRGAAAVASGFSGLQDRVPQPFTPTGQTPPVATVQPIPAADPIAAPVAEWKRLQQSDGYPFADYARFLLAHPGWPGETGRRAVAETVLPSGADDPSLVNRFFDRFPPRTGAGRVRQAEALAAAGRMEEARSAARAAWRTGALRPADEARVIGGFPGAIGAADHDVRMDRLLWQGSTSAAQRLATLVSPAKRATFDARLAYRTNAIDAGMRGDQPGVDRNDPGYIADRATWLRGSGQSAAARALLAQPRRLTSLPGDPHRWFKVLIENARAAQADGQYQTAYQIASQVDDAYAPGTDVSTLSYGERDEYTNLTWLAGQTALKQLRRPNDAVGMFARYSGGSQTPTTRSKGYYWAARAADAANDTATAQRWYEQAATLPDVYYGQLAHERLRRTLRAPGSQAGTTAIAPAVRQAFFNREIVRAARWLGATGARSDQGAFVRQIASDATSDTDHALAAELATQINRPDLGVLVGKSALQNGHSDYTVAGYPTVTVPTAQSHNYTLVHAITRQESQFDRAAVSHAGARGLMQLMPATARETATRMGLGYDASQLTNDPAYNLQLGSTYIQRMLDYYGGSYPLAIAAYNAGAGNVNKWIRANGDPRLPGVDVVEWVEAIPYTETRGYVQRVLENAVVYDLLYPAQARSRAPNHISWYLGKNQPG